MDNAGQPTSNHVPLSLVTMASRLLRNSDKGPPPSMEPAGKLHFFKIILSGALRDGKIGIPKKFVHRFGKNLPDTMSLKVPDGAVWKLGLVRGDDGEVWLKRGWRAFAEHYSIEHGHLLVFRYESDSVFRVLIFDTTACEIEYPSSTHDQQQDPVNEVRGSVPAMVETPRADTGKSDGVLRTTRNTNPKAEARSPSLRQPAKKKSHRNPPRKADVNKTSGGATGLKFVKLEADVDSRMAGPNASHNDPTRRRMAPLNSNSSKEVVVGALERAMAFKPVNPFFRVKMGPSYLSWGYAKMSMWFAKAYLQKTKSVTVKVRGWDGRMWPLKYSRRRNTYGWDAAYLSSGWKRFVRDNHLKLGDVCVFELLKSSPILLKLFIFRNNPKMQEKEKGENGERGDLSPPLPVLDEEGRRGNLSVSVSVSCNSDHGNGIMGEKAGSQATDDECKMIAGFDHRQIESKSGPNRAGQDYQTRESRRRGSSKEVVALGALERAMAFKPVNPVFLVKMGPAYLRKAYAHIPMWFVKAYLKKRNQSVKVWGSDGRTWSINCRLHRWVSRGYETAELRSGWRIFVRDNQLKLGDVCAFELLKSTPVLLKLFIFRNSTHEDHHQE